MQGDWTNASGVITRQTAQVINSKAGALASAVILVLALGFFKVTRPYSVPIGVIIIAIWYFKWQSHGGKP
jgi:hypothetical protein